MKFLYIFTIPVFDDPHKRRRNELRVEIFFLFIDYYYKQKIRYKFDTCK